MDNVTQDPVNTRLKAVLRDMPAPVAIVTSLDPDSGQPVGLAISALMPVCLEPPAMSVCVNRSGSAHESLVRSGRFCINLLHPGQDDHVVPFADPNARERRFGQSDWKQLESGPHKGLWYIAGAPAAMFCTIRERVAFGTHDVLIGEVDELIAEGGEIVGWVNGALCRSVGLSRLDG